MPLLWTHRSGRSDHVPDPFVPPPPEWGRELDDLVEIRYLFERLLWTTCVSCGERLDGTRSGGAFQAKAELLAP